MRVIYHIGLHSTDEDRALRCLLRNDDMLQRAGSVAAVPGRFRPVLREAMIELKGRPADAAIQARVLAAVTDLDAPKRLIFSNDSFLCVPRRAIEGGTLYPLVGERAPWIRNLFPGYPAEFAFALRNPATLIPALQARFADQESFDAYLRRIDPEALSWVDMVTRLRAASPDCPLTIWCNEDSPLIWPEILQALSGVEDGMALDGVHDFLAAIMSEEGIRRMLSYLESHPRTGAELRRKIVSAFLAKYAQAEAVEEEFDLPGWTADRIARLTETYETEVEQVAAMDGVAFLRP